MREGYVVEGEMGYRLMFCGKVSDGEGRSLSVEGCWNERGMRGGRRNGVPVDVLWKSVRWRGKVTVCGVMLDDERV